MKKYRFLLIMALFLGSCQTAAPAPIPTATFIPTSTSSPVPTPTDTPPPTFTPEPSPTPIILPDLLSETFSNVSVRSRQSFEYVIQGVAPTGWLSEEQGAIWTTTENQLEAKSLPSSGGTVFYYTGEIISPNQGVFFTFKYTGSKENFTLGFDNVKTNGERVLGEGFRSVAMEMRDQNLIVYGNQARSTSKGLLKGNLRLLEDTWYNIALAFDEDHNFIIKIWQPDNTDKQLTYLRQWQDFPDHYYFISWLSSKRALLIDDFTIFDFSEILQK